MNLPLPLLIIACVSWAISAWLVWLLWKSQEPLWFKIVGTLTAAIPFFGPFLYSFLQMPPKIPIHLRATMNHRGRGGRFIGFGSKQFNYDPIPDQTDNQGDSDEGLQQRKVRRLLTAWEKVGLIVACIFLSIYWTQALSNLESGDAWGHSNYWGQHVGTFLLIAVLLAGSVAFLAVVWRFWLSRYFEPDARQKLMANAGPTSRSKRTRRKRNAG